MEFSKSYGESHGKSWNFHSSKVFELYHRVQMKKQNLSSFYQFWFWLLSFWHIFQGLLQAYDSIQASDFSPVIFEDEIEKEPSFTDLGSEPEKEDIGQIISVEHHQENAEGNDDDTYSAETSVTTVFIDYVDCGVDSDYCVESKDVDEAEGAEVRNIAENFTEKGNGNTDLLWLDTDETDGNETEVSENFADKGEDTTDLPGLDRPTVSQTYATDCTLEVEEQGNKKAKDTLEFDNRETQIRDVPITTDIEKDTSVKEASIEENGFKEKECTIENINVDGSGLQPSNSAVKTVILFRNSKETLVSVF